MHWTTTPSLQHHSGALIYHHDKLLLLGGYFDGGTGEVEEYDIVRNTCHDLEVMSPSPDRVELGVRGTSVVSCT